MASEDTSNEPLTPQDITFTCKVCGKSLVINALGAGLAITCPDCGTELQVPQSDGAEAAPSEAALEAAETKEDNEEAEQEFPDISDVLANDREQIAALTLQVEELELRRRFLEKRHALASMSLQSLRRESIMIRQAMDRIDAVLKNLEEHSAGDTQPIA